MTPLPFDKLEQVYERLAEAVDTAGPANEALFLAKLVLVMAHRAGEGLNFADCVAVALEDLPDDAHPSARGDEA